MLGFTRIGRLLRPGADRLAARDAYALWADVYPPRPHNPLMEAEQAVVAPMLSAIAESLGRVPHHRPRRALDLGTGTGRYVPLLAPAGPRLTVGVDLSMPMLVRQGEGRPRLCADACCLPFRDSAFDVVCSSLMAGDVEALDAWVREAARVLAVGGHLVYSDFHPRWRAHHWRRTFRSADGRLIELPYFAHAIEDHLAALSRASFSIRTIREPRLKGRDTPVVAVFHAVKGRRGC